jgi:hypothetical protein
VEPHSPTQPVHGPHQQYQVSGRIHLVMSDSTEIDSGGVPRERDGRAQWTYGPMAVLDTAGRARTGEIRLEGRCR